MAHVAQDALAAGMGMTRQFAGRLSLSPTQRRKQALITDSYSSDR